MADAQSNAFEEKIEEMIEQLGSGSASKRRAAAYFLGEVAAEDAVPALVDVYQKDKNASVRAAAAYSLGMYKAVERALNAGQEKKVVRLLTQVEKGNIGSRAPVGRAVKIVIALLIVLIVLVVAFVLSVDIKGMLFGSSKPHSAIVADVQKSYDLVKSDTRTLQTDLLDVISNHTLSCVSFFNNPGPYALDPVDGHTYPDIGTIVGQLNTAQASLASAKARYDAACNNHAQFGAAEAQQTFQVLLPALQVLDPLELELTQAESLQPTPTSLPPTSAIVSTSVPALVQPTTISATAASGATTAPASNVTLQPTVVTNAQAQADIKAHLPALFNIIDDVTAPRGASSLLVQYWTDAQSTGSTQGCSIAKIPDIPNNDVFIPEIDFQASPDLRDAVQLINSGLAALHTGWVNFQFACNSRDVASKATSELANAKVAAAAFAAATIKLQMVQGGS